MTVFWTVLVAAAALALAGCATPPDSPSTSPFSGAYGGLSGSGS